MVNRNRSSIFYLLLVVVASVMVGMVLASRLDLASSSSAQTLGVPAVNSAPITGPVSATTFREVAKAVTPAVVNIRSESLQTRESGDLSDLFPGLTPEDLPELFRRRTPPGNGQGNGQGQRRREQPEEELVQGRGTGFIIDKSGLILTNNHVVEGATRIRVSLYGEDEDQEYTARVIGRDELTDSALIELTQKPDHDLPTVKFGDSGIMQPGDWVMAIGNPFGLDHTVSVGVISANRGGNEGLRVASLRRADVLQTDAAINPGNSGGPLINLRGEVIGVNTAIATTGLSQGNMGVGFAIPSNTIREILPQLRAGKVTRGRVGVQVGDVSRRAIDELGLKEKTGALVTSVEEESPAEKAGLDEGDIILAWNGKPVKSSDELVRTVVTTKPGTAVPVRILRDGKERSMSITVEELDLDAENGTRRERTELSSVKPEQNKGFGMTIDNVTGELTRRLKLPENQRGAIITAIDPGSPADEAPLTEGDVIFKVGRTPVASAAEAQRELNRVPAGGTALIHVVRQDPRGTTKGYREVFVMVTKE
jgi:serine protease Do